MIWLSTYIHDFRILKRVPGKNSMFQTRIYSWCCPWSALDLCDIVCDYLKYYCVTYDTMWYDMLCWEHVRSFEPIWTDVKSCYVACNSFDYGRFIGNWSTSHGNHLKHVHSDRESWCWWIQCIPCEHVQSNEITWLEIMVADSKIIKHIRTHVNSHGFNIPLLMMSTYTHSGAVHGQYHIRYGDTQ